MNSETEKSTQHERALFRENVSFEKHKWVRLTFVCNNNCIFCHDHGHHDGTARPVADIIKEFREGREQGCTRLIVSGGEATMHPDFIELVRAGKELGYRRVQVVSNGRRFAYRDFLDEAVRAGLGEITFSIHGHTAELHDAQTRVPGSFAQACAALINALRRGDVIVNMDIVINKKNVATLRETMDFFIALGVHEFDLLHLSPYGEAWNNRDELFYDPTEEIHHINRALELSREPGLAIWTNRLPAKYLTSFPELIQNPVKIYDEVNGRRDLFEPFASGEKDLFCRGERCEFCFLENFCAELVRTREAAASGRAPAVLAAPDKQALAARFTAGGGCTLIIKGSALKELRVADVPEDAAEIILDFEDYRGIKRFAEIAGHVDVRALASDLNSLKLLSDVPSVEAWLEMNKDTAAALAGPKGKKQRFAGVVFMRNRASLEASIERDAPIRDLFSAEERPTRRGAANTPLCAFKGIPVALPWFLDTGALQGKDGINLEAFTASFIQHRYYVYPIECTKCRLKKRCPGVQVHHYRAFGFTPSPMQKINPARPEPQTKRRVARIE